MRRVLWLLVLFALILALLVATGRTVSVTTAGHAPGRSGFVKYLPGAGAPFHERLLLAKAHGTHWAIATPDLVTYVEDLADPVNLDETFAAIATDGTMPRMVVGMPTYTVGDFNDF